MGETPPDHTSEAGTSPVSIETLFLELESPLLGYARRLIPEADMAEDIVQEAFLRLHRHRDEIRSPRPWLYRTVHNLALNRHRADRRIVPLPAPGPGGEETGPDLDPMDPLPLPDEQIARWEGVGLVRLNLKNLAPRTQELIRLKFDENLSYKEIAARTGLSTGNVGYILHHSLKSLADDLAKAGLAP